MPFLNPIDEFKDYLLAANNDKERSDLIKSLPTSTKFCKGGKINGRKLQKAINCVEVKKKLKEALDGLENGSGLAQKAKVKKIFSILGEESKLAKSICEKMRQQKAIDCEEARKKLQEALDRINQVNQGLLAGARVREAFVILGEESKLGKTIYGKMSQHTEISLRNISHQYQSSQFTSEAKVKAIEEAIKCLEAHWSHQLLKEQTSVAQEVETTSGIKEALQRQEKKQRKGVTTNQNSKFPYTAKIRGVKVAIKCLEAHWSHKLLQELMQQKAVKQSNIMGHFQKLQVEEGKRGVAPNQSQLTCTDTVTKVAIKCIANFADKLSMQQEEITQRLKTNTLPVQQEAVTQGLKTEPNTMEELQKLREEQRKRGVAPVDEVNPNILMEVSERFLEIFKAAPAHLKKQIANEPLFPSDANVKLDHVRPINYIIFTANVEALELIADYLSDEEWLKRGPYESTLMHCLIAGIEKLATEKGDPLKCAEFLWKKFPSLTRKKNQYKTAPFRYAKQVAGTLIYNSRKIGNDGASTYGGGSLRIGVTDSVGGSYVEYQRSYDVVLKQAADVASFLEFR